MRAGQIWSSKLNVDIRPNDVKLIEYLGHDIWSVIIIFSDWESKNRMTGEEIINLYDLKVEA